MTASNANGSYKAGQTIHVQVNFTEPVTVTGTPQLRSRPARPTRPPTYASGSGTSTLGFDYTVQAGDNSADLDYHGINALSLNGGSIADPPPTTPPSPSPSPARPARSAPTRTSTIDTTAPTVSGVTASNANGAYKAGQTIHVQVDFSEPVTVTGSPQLALNTRRVRCLRVRQRHARRSTFDYTVQAGDNVATLDYAATNALTLNGGTIARRRRQQRHAHPRRPGQRRLPRRHKSLTIDTTAPTVSNVTASNPTAPTRPARPSTSRSTSRARKRHRQPAAALETATPPSPPTTPPAAAASTLAFDYTVQAGDNSADLDYPGTGASPSTAAPSPTRPPTTPPSPSSARAPPARSAPTRTSPSTPPPRPSATSPPRTPTAPTRPARPSTSRSTSPSR